MIPKVFKDQMQTHVRAFFQDNNANFVPLLLFELLEANRCAQTCRASSYDADVYLILCPLHSSRIEGLIRARRRRSERPARGQLCPKARNRSRGLAPYHPGGERKTSNQETTSG